MADERVSMPASTAGITRFFDDYRSKIEIKPGHVVVISLLVVVVIILLNAYLGPVFGLA